MNRAALKEGNGNEDEVPVLSRNDERYLLQALEFEGVLRACLYRYTRNNSDVDELLQEVYARLLVAGSSNDPEVRSVRAFALTIARNVASQERRSAFRRRKKARRGESRSGPVQGRKQSPTYPFAALGNVIELT